MNIREKLEQREHEFLSPYAAFSDRTAGRDFQEELCDLRPEYQRDRDKILHSKSFRRLKGKTQVFLDPEGDHYRNRLTHTLEVAQIARSIAKALRLNEDLTEAIALGHDLGHTPFGHAGERALNRVAKGGFHHSEQSIRVVERLEKQGAGLNLTKEVRDGILNHQTAGHPATMEGKVVRLADKIAYVNHDIDDAIRGHIICENDIPEKFTKVLGSTTTLRLNKLIHDVITSSEDRNDVIMSAEVETAMVGLRRFMFENVYTNPTAKGQEAKAEALIEQLFEYFMHHSEMLPGKYLYLMDRYGDSLERVVCDYIAGMTDHFATDCFRDRMIPYGWDVY